MNYTLKGEKLFKKITLYIKLLFIPFKTNSFRPKFLQSNVLFYGVICLLIIKIIGVIVFINFPANIFFADITKTALISLVNRERLSLGIQSLIENKKLNEAALLKAKDILEKDYFSHQSPDGITPWYWFLKTGYNYKYAGENLAIGFLNSEDVYKAWINSISHKENIINPNYKEIGTAVLTGEYKGTNTTVIVQLFGSPKKINTPVIKKTIEETPIIEKQLLDENIKEQIVINNPITKEEILSQITEAPLEENDIMHYKFLNFIFFDSDKIFEYMVYFLLILTEVALLLNILINFTIQDRHLILRSLIIIMMLVTIYIL